MIMAAFVALYSVYMYLSAAVADSAYTAVSGKDRQGKSSLVRCPAGMPCMCDNNSFC